MTTVNAQGLWGEWFSVQRLEPGVTMIGEPRHAEDVKSYLVEGTERAALLDTGIGVGDIAALVAELTDLPVTVVTTHAHWDHVGGHRLFDDVRAPALSHVRLAAGWSDERMARALADDQLRGPLPDGFDRDHAAIPPVGGLGTVRGGDRIDLGGRTLEVIAAPGHCPDLIVLLDRANGILFGTDAVYADALYAQSDESDIPAYRRTLDELVDLIPALRVVYASHGAGPFDPLLIQVMHDAMDAVVAGRVADRTAAGVDRHEFGPFSILVPARVGPDRDTSSGA